MKCFCIIFGFYPETPAGLEWRRQALQLRSPGIELQRSTWAQIITGIRRGLFGRRGSRLRGRFVKVRVTGWPGHRLSHSTLHSADGFPLPRTHSRLLRRHPNSLSSKSQNF